MFGKKSNGDKHIASLIGAGSTFVGDLTFAGGLRIDGTVQGSVRCVGGEGSGMLVISEKGAVEGEVRAAHMVVAGRITGPVYTTELVELQPTAKVTGDVQYRALEIHHGADQVQKAEQAIAALQAGVTPQVCERPQTPWCVV